MSYKPLEEVKQRLERLGTYELNEEKFVEVADCALKEDKPIDRLIEGYHQLLGEVSNEMKQMDDHMGMTPTCQMGCAFCCYFPIIITRLEAKMIIRSIESMNEERRQNIKTHLKEYFEGNKDNVEYCTTLDFQNRDVKFDYMKAQLPCPLLNTETNTCMAYESRPLPCRTYVNYMDPKICADNLVPEETVSFEFLYEDYMGNLNEIAQEVAHEDDTVEYPEDLFEYNYLPVFLKDWIQRGE
ncbi:YkgJ family cysteine cluster protein [Alkalibacillus haloalkaliphilus]|uniref:YkgJ family cysteine cluster protein n=1 Tax=Alkalibacillus haloalkaliphilus TaxID=94136 RepID=UPI0029356FDD|nr:YkgJ family cysteine cluster protein [Alkalibacillus haloalkaliphilus]MDV2581841.1 YkgJ family cysteine cluster protein [Alkalibacillus haloalkaliphilus]